MLAEETAYFAEKIDAQIPDIQDDVPLVIFLDGRGVTRDHGTYKLMNGRYQRQAVDAAHKAAGEEECYIYAVLDEVSIVFPHPQSFLKRHQYKSHDEVIASFLQEFLSVFWKKYGDYVTFHAYAFSLNEGEEKRYLKWRHERSQQAIYTYAAKEYQIEADYSSITCEELKTLLRQRGVLQEIQDNKNFVKGTLLQCNHNGRD